MTTSRPTFPHTIDSTILGSFRSCPQKMFRTYVQHWKPQSESVHLIAGGAFAKGVEVARKVFFEGIIEGKEGYPDSAVGAGDPDLAMAYGLEALIKAYGDFSCPPDSAKSLERMCGALEYYFDTFPLGADGMKPLTFPNGQVAIEFSFAEPLDILHPVTGDPILYTGRTDMIAEYAGGVYVVDEKTTSSLGASWAKQWDMRAQFTGYVWAAKRNGLNPTGAMVRGISILKTKYDHMQVPTYRSDYEVSRWEAQTIKDIRRMIQCWESGEWDYNLDHSCAEYGGCSLQRVCKSSNPDGVLPVYFAQKVWDPLARRELTLEEYEASWAPPKTA